MSQLDSRFSPGRSPDWTTGPAKWAAVGVLCIASVGGMAWSIWGREPRRETASARGSGEASAAPVKAASSGAGREVLLKEAPPPAGASEPASPTTGLGASRLINLNAASAAELELLPGIGPALASRIIEHRTTRGPFKTVDELEGVKGIGPRTLARIRDLVTVK
jgi:competence ComEA-like helix-hairpin-helix protein